MKIAIIDYKWKDNRLCSELEARGIKSDTAKSREQFESQYESLGKYDGLVLHSDIGNWNKYLNEIPRDYPALKFAIATHGLGDYFDGGNVRVFDFSDVDGIVEYFLSKKQKITKEEVLKTLFI